MTMPNFTKRPPAWLAECSGIISGEFHSAVRRFQRRNQSRCSTVQHAQLHIERRKHAEHPLRVWMLCPERDELAALRGGCGRMRLGQPAYKKRDDPVVRRLRTT